jgi:L-ascorbate metabolism protein UlaG (beta-lactamase superfamily)
LVAIGGAAVFRKAERVLAWQPFDRGICYGGWEMKISLGLAALALVAGMGMSAYAQGGREVQTFKTSKGDVRITPIYHAALMIQAGGKNIIVDPAKPADVSGLPPADLILLTDIHGDHLDPNLIAKVSKPGTQSIAPPAVVKTVTTAMPLSNGETKEWEGWKIEAVPMYNLKRGPSEGKLFHDKGRGNGYVLTYGGKRFYLSGDTEDTPEMEALRNIDVAFVCMNLPYTMTPEEAAVAVKAFHPKVVIPYHYGQSDLSVFKKALEGTGIEVRILDWYPKAGA